MPDGWLESDSEEEDASVGSVASSTLSTPSASSPAPPAALAAAPEVPFPWAACLLICAINLINSASYLMTFPFVAFQILSFFPGLPTQDVGFYSGVLEASFHVGCIPGALFWSWVADRYGRRPALLYGLLGTAGCCVAFGLAPNFACALAARFFWGLLNGNVGVAKTVMSELATDVHMARAFSYIGLNSGAGRILGPAIGGLLSEPGKRFPGTPQLFLTFPFLLPCIICGLLSAATCLASYFVLQETLPAAAAAAAVAAAAAPQDSKGVNSTAGEISMISVISVLAEEDADRVEVVEASDDETAGLVAAPPASTLSPAPQQPQQPPSTPALQQPLPPLPESAAASYLRLLRDSQVFGAVGNYAAMGSVGIITQELYPLLVINGPERGGFGLTSVDLGLLNMSAGVPLLLFQLLLFPALSKWLGVVAVQTWSLGLAAGMLALTPAISAANGVLSAPSLTALLYCHFIANTVVRVSGFVANFVVVANAAPAASDRAKVCVGRSAERLSSTHSTLTAARTCTHTLSLSPPHTHSNGLGQALVSIGRAVGPGLATPLFALSVSDQAMRLGFPFNYGLTFYLSALATGACCYWSSTLPCSLNVKRASS